MVCACVCVCVCERERERERKRERQTDRQTFFLAQTKVTQTPFPSYSVALQ